MAPIRLQPIRHYRVAPLGIGSIIVVLATLLYFFGSDSGFFAAINLTGFVLFLVVGLTFVGIGLASVFENPRAA
jgi:hypothetical protein